MKKSQRIKINPPKKNKSRKRLTKNPIFGKSTSPFDGYLKNILGNAVVQTALLGCTMEEKTLVAAFIPLLLTFIRKVPRKDLEIKVNEILDRDYPKDANTST